MGIWSRLFARKPVDPVIADIDRQLEEQRDTLTEERRWDLLQQRDERRHKLELPRRY